MDEPMVVSDEADEVPVCTNFAALAAGAELMLFKDESARGGVAAAPKAKGKNAKAKARAWMQEKDVMDCARAAKKARPAA